jgi:hypothetical protein
MKIKTAHSSPAASDVTVVSRRLGHVVQVLNKGEGRLIPVVRVDRSKAASPGAQRHQEQEQNRSRDCSGTSPNCCQLPPTDPSWAGVSLFPQVSRLGR